MTSCRSAWTIAAVMAIVAALSSAALLRFVLTERHEDPLEAVKEKIASLDAELRPKLCAHRANNIPKYRAARETFTCIEIDIVIDPPTGNSIAVYHPPAENHFGLSLRFLLQHESLPDRHLWLDVKDLSESNWRKLLSELDALIPAARRGDVIVETGWRGETVRDATAALRDHGYMVSYYLPTEAALECQATRSKRCLELRENVADTLLLGFSHLSFDARTYPFVETLRDALPSSTRLLTWDITPAWPRRELIGIVDIYIIRYPHPHST